MMDSYVGGDFVSCEYKYSVGSIEFMEQKLLQSTYGQYKLKWINHLNMTFRVKSEEKQREEERSCARIQESKSVMSQRFSSQ